MEYTFQKKLKLKYKVIQILIKDYIQNQNKLNKFKNKFLNKNN